MIVSIASSSDRVEMKSPIFFIGAPRSGTSLISQIIGSHPAIAVPYESHFYNTFAPWVRHYGDLKRRRNRQRLVRDVLRTAMVRAWVPRVDESAALGRIDRSGRFDLNGVFAGIMEAWCAAQGKRRWGEKTPAHVFFADRILQGFPDARFVYIVRDGRDAALSWLRAGFGPQHIYPAARGWLRFLQAARKLEEGLGGARFCKLRYEDLLRDPEQLTRRVCEFLSEEYSANMLDFYRSEGRYPTDVRNKTNLARPVMADNAGKWRHQLSARQIRIFEAVAGKELEAHGYERAEPNARLSALERLWFRVSHPPRRVLAIARHTQGQLDGLIRLMIYLRLRAGF